MSNAFRADANLVRLVAEAHRLQHAYLFNPIFATETSLIDPLPHQFIAVYEHLLKHFPLRFLLADDAGAGKTIMAGLYIQEALLRKKGFDLESRHPTGEVRYIEVKGRAGITSVELTANEWRQAANHRDRYWLYVVYHCDTDEPRLYPCRDPFGTLIARATGSIRINAGDIMKNSDIERSI